MRTKRSTRKVHKSSFLGAYRRTSASLFSNPSTFSLMNGQIARIGAYSQHLGIDEFE